MHRIGISKNCSNQRYRAYCVVAEGKRVFTTRDRKKARQIASQWAEDDWVLLVPIDHFTSSRVLKKFVADESASVAALWALLESRPQKDERLVENRREAREV